MTGDGHAHEPPGSHTNWSGDDVARRLAPSDGSTDRLEHTPAATVADQREHTPATTVEGDDRARDVDERARDVDELEARLVQRDADIQHVIDRYEAVLEDQEAAEQSGPRTDGVLQTARRRLHRFLIDLEISFNRRLR
jgi:hypothetical protein